MRPGDTSEQIAVLEKKFDYYVSLFRWVAIIGLGWMGVIVGLLFRLLLLVEKWKT